ncbi:PREDICTED: nuclear GTPase SLIP-GC-like isoform X1 [Poecilia mexicana]|uniref:nuclear GTPase SLIP-GC-like isoform X1 n=1 Tax=Poecilia mexicana TaxID=48701 RepID=UPI00072EDC1B|nr:PREDICTED: nuclear GTPase SLIP-GC-like isoform X1 [Poecilia mexicana]
MDDFVCDTLAQAGLSDLIKVFKDEGIDRESFDMLQDADIEKLIPKMGPRLKFKNLFRRLKAEQTPNESPNHFPTHGHQKGEATDVTEVLRSTSGTEQGKRKSGQQLDSKGQPAAKRKCETNSSTEREAKILSEVREIMGDIYAKLQDDGDLNKFLKNEITKLSTDKREMVGVFGKTGAGKSSLINAVIGQANLLPIGDLNACTSVMIKVEANMEDKYEAEIEFITKEGWQDEMWSMWQYLCDHMDQENDDEDDDYENKLSAHYGKDRKQTKPDEFMDPKNFREIPEFLQSKTKTLTFHSAEMLSEGIAKYTKNDPNQGEGKKLKRLYWPLVKCVTVKVPNIPLLQHVTLVDLPGNGDRNKSRDQMWKEIVGKCSTVWIVADITRPASEKQSWQILKRTASLMGNGGECQNIHFICTKSDVFEDFQQHTAEDRLNLILDRNMKTKLAVKEEFKKLHNVKKHFSEDNFEVFTVSSKEFLVGELKEHSEIPKLQKVLQDLNDCHSETLNYVSGAHGILSLIHGASKRKEDDRIKEVCKALEENLTSLQTESINNEMKKICKAFNALLQKGVEESKNSCEDNLMSTLYPEKRDGRGFHKQLKKAVENEGVCRPKKGREMNINMNLTSPLTDSIDEEFRTTFPNDGKCGPFKGVIYGFSILTKELKEKYKDVELQLISLESEEERLKISLNKSIRKRKKTVYRSLAKTIGETMQDCYNKAAACTGRGTLQNMRETIENHVHRSKNTMFEDAKKVMMNQLQNLMVDVLKTLVVTMRESIELSLKTGDLSLPDVSAQLERVQKLRDELRSC